MKDYALRDLEWVIGIKYALHPDSELHISCLECVDILSALAKAVRHCQESYPYEIISIKQSNIL